MSDLEILSDELPTVVTYLIPSGINRRNGALRKSLEVKAAVFSPLSV